MTTRPRGRLALALSLLTACATTPVARDRDKEVEQRLDQLEARARADKELSSQLAALRDRQAQLDASLAELRKHLDELKARRPAAEKPPVNGEKGGEELARLRKALEEQARRSDEQARRIEALNATVAELRAAPPAARGARREAPAAASPPPAKALSGQADLLALAREQEAKGERVAARELYQQYVKSWPGDRGAAEAHFRLGELAYADRQYRDALLEFGRVAQDFPQSDRAPVALLRTADSMQAIGLQDDATSVLTEVQKRYPGTPAAARARDRLSQGAKAAGGKAP